MSVQGVAVDKDVPEQMVGDAAHPAWTGDHSFRARYRLEVDSDRCTVTVTLRIHLVGATTAAERKAWTDAIMAKWNNRFKLCCDDDCIQGYAIRFILLFVGAADDPHVTVTVHPAAAPAGADMANWNIGDTTDVTHEFGHCIGNPDEYFTVNGHDYGPGRQVPSNVMNNPADDPEPRHLSMIREIASVLLGGSNRCIARRVTEPCQ